MTDKFDDGGPAYPIWNDSEFKGMTLRDAFAMAAMQGMLADRETILRFTEECHKEMIGPEVGMAAAAYGMADAMIAERNKRRGEG